MIPKVFEYPEFVANQVLQKSHLNSLFNYLDENNRLTRTNLLGIGIVCGLEVIPLGNTQIRITKGCGVTSAGYLVTFGEKNGVLEDITYSSAKTYKVPEELLYSPFYDSSNKQNRFEMWELSEATTASNPAPAGFTLLSDAFLNPNAEGNKKVVLLFVELLENINKNCSPISCDDKGANVGVVFRPLLIKKSDADILLAEVNSLNGAGSYQAANASYALPDIRMRRFDVPKSALSNVSDIIDAYKLPLNQTFIENTLKVNLQTAYNEFAFFLNGISNEIASFNPPYNAGKVELNNAYEYQYYYDFITDLMAVYAEIQHIASEIMPVCCPDERLFPRHLFLALATENSTETRSDYRHYFIPSPILSKGKKKVAELRSVFSKLMIMLGQNIFRVPNPVNSQLKITPSILGGVPLSKKAIPYYYDLAKAPKRLYEYWNFEKTDANKANQNLAYFSNLYNPAGPDFVNQALWYDLEPYNFLRIEGHVGLDFREALKRIVEQRDTHRLPFDVLAIQTGNINTNTMEISAEDCHFGDLEINWDVTRREWESIVGKVIEYLDDRFEANDIKDISTTIHNKCKTLQSKLVISKGYMVNDLADYISTHNIFIPLYEDIEERAKIIRQDLLNLSTVKSNELVEDLIDHMDELIHAEHKGPFRAIYQEYIRRFNKIKEQLALNYYANTHVGLQHKAGVPFGGTFILVYEKKKGNDKASDQSVIADFYLPYLCCSDCCGGQVIVLPSESIPEEPPLKLELKFSRKECEGKRFIVAFDVVNGVAPFQVFVDQVINQTSNTGSIVIDNLGNIGNHIVHVIDANGQKSVVELINVTSCCDLPCDGNQLSCEFLFIPRVLEKETFFEVITLTSLQFSGTDIANKPLNIDLQNGSEILFEGILSSSNYDAVKEEVLKKIFQIFSKLGLTSEILNLENVGPDKLLERISLSWFECHEFSFVINQQIRELESSIEFVYSDKGVRVITKNSQTDVPKFNCLRINRCTEIIERLCQKEPKLELIKMENLDKSVQFSTIPAPNTAQYLWLFGNPDDDKNQPTPRISGNVNPILNKRNLKRIEVEVYVFMNGCMATKKEIFNIG